ncbi:MAG: alpha/beta hydrolase [Buchananella hordeovulneris]|nr:alpha/beta hydrolase [Buchananella hordeovulneris]
MNNELAITRFGTAGQLPLVLLHGFPVDGRMWDLLRPALAAEGCGDVIVVDGPGFGQSGPLVDEQGGSAVEGLEGYADSVAAALRHAGVERAVVAGLSMGGYVAVALAERHPELVAGLAMLDTKSTADAPEAAAGRLAMAQRAPAEGSAVVAAMVANVLAPATLEGGEALERYRAMADAAAGGAIAWAQRAMAARPDRTSVLAALRERAVPGLVLRGEFDKPCTPADAAHMAEHLGAQVVTVSGAGHFPALENPPATARALADLLERAGA